MARGSIEPRVGNNRTSWRVRVDFIDPHTGRRSQPSRTFDTQRAAEKGLRDWLRELEQGIQVRANGQTFGAWLDEWLREYKEQFLRPTTYAGYCEVINRTIVPALGAVPLQKLTTRQLQAQYTHLRRDGRADGKGGLSVERVRYARTVVGQALAEAQAQGLIAANPNTRTKVAGERREPRLVWTEAQARTFLAASVDEPLYPLLLLALSTGMRRGELLGLRWQDVDLAARVLRVRQCVVLLHNRIRIQPPKTAAGRRTIDISPACVAALRAHRAAQLALHVQRRPVWQDTDLLFTNSIGGAISPDNMRDWFLARVAAAGVPRIRFHDLRHTAASLYLAAHTPLSTVAERLGHAGTHITAQVYAHAIPGTQRAAADALDAALVGTDLGTAASTAR